MKGKATLKGISMPIEMIVIIAIAVLVLVVIAAFFIGGFKPGGISHNAAWAEGCNRWIVTGCTDITMPDEIQGYDWDNDEVTNTFLDACKYANKLDVDISGNTIMVCNKKLCGCPPSSYASP